MQSAADDQTRYTPLVIATYACLTLGIVFLALDFRSYASDIQHHALDPDRLALLGRAAIIFCITTVLSIARTISQGIYAHHVALAAWLLFFLSGLTFLFLAIFEPNSGRQSVLSGIAGVLIGWTLGIPMGDYLKRFGLTEDANGPAAH